MKLLKQLYYSVFNVKQEIVLLNNFEKDDYISEYYDIKEGSITVSLPVSDSDDLSVNTYDIQKILKSSEDLKPVFLQFIYYCR